MERTRTALKSTGERIGEGVRRRAAPSASGSRLSLVPTGSTLLNCAVSDDPRGGWKTAGMINIIGDSHTGKTLGALTLCAEAVRSPVTRSHEIYYDDIEAAAIFGTFDIARLFGEETKRAIKPALRGPRKHSGTIDEWHENLLKMLKRGRPVIYVTDSLDGLLSAEEAAIVEKISKGLKLDKKESIADRARKMSTALRELNGPLERTNSLLVIVSQTRQDISVRFGDPRVRAGGKALDFYANHIVWLIYTGRIKHGTVTIGRNVEVRSTKSRVTGKERNAPLNLYYDYGIDDLGANVDWLIANGVWPKVTVDGQSKLRADGLDGTPLGTRDTLIGVVERRGLEEAVVDLVGEKWTSLESEYLLKRKPRYGGG